MRKLFLLFVLVFFLVPTLLNAEEYDGRWSNITKQCGNIGKLAMDIVIENSKLKFLCNNQIHRIEKKGKKEIKITGFGKTYLLGKINENKITMKFKKTKDKALKKCTLEFIKVEQTSEIVKCDSTKTKTSNQRYDPTRTGFQSKCTLGSTCTWTDIESDPELYEQYLKIKSLPIIVPVNKNSIESKLKKLKSLFDQDLITQDEYDAKRKEILDAM